MFCSAQGNKPENGISFLSIHRDSYVNLPWIEAGSSLIIAKSHNPLDDFLNFIVDSESPAVITVRDPRDALVSLMQRFSKSFDEALKAVEYSMRPLVELQRRRELPAFRDRVAEMLGVDLSEESKDAIFAGLAREAVKKKITELEAAGAIRDEQVWDRETHWHADHGKDLQVSECADL